MDIINHGALAAISTCVDEDGCINGIDQFAGFDVIVVILHETVHGFAPIPIGVRLDDV